jgi:hypothetical protein
MGETVSGDRLSKWQCPQAACQTHMAAWPCQCSPVPLSAETGRQFRPQAPRPRPVHLPDEPAGVGSRAKFASFFSFFGHKSMPFAYYLWTDRALPKSSPLGNQALS